MFEGAVHWLHGGSMRFDGLVCELAGWAAGPVEVHARIARTASRNARFTCRNLGGS